ncbi:hypothetical protein [Flagellimonas beolgyonensis]|uniref:hypothetical protein n=1 Tax=Flagellimonas beolgyonensis TaxID=864064 RepID=UPI000F8E7F2E|nr:hypothetical protein [Allomuricauda beolgyonensis]
MKNTLLLGLLVFMALSTLQAQQTPTSPKPIDMKINLLGYRFFQDGERLNWRELEAATVAVEEANQLIKRAKSQRTFSNVLAFVGGGFIGVPLGQQSANRDPNWELAYIGGAIAVVSFHLSFRAFNNVNKGVDTYNMAIAPSTSYRFQPEVFVINNQNGFGLSVRF